MTNTRQTAKRILVPLLMVLMILISLPVQAVDYGDSKFKQPVITLNNGTVLTPGTTPTIAYYTDFRVDYEFSTDEIKNGDTMEVAYPSALVPVYPVGEPFNVKAAGDVVMGTGVIVDLGGGRYSIKITFNSNVEGLGNPVGKMYFTGNLISVESGQHTITTNVGGNEVKYTVNRNPKPGIKPDETNAKYVSLDEEYPGEEKNSVYRWFVRIHAGGEVDPWTDVTITDRLGPYQYVLPHRSTSQTEYFRIRYTNEEGNGAEYYTGPYTFTNIMEGDKVVGFTLKLPAVTKGMLVDFYVKRTVPTADIPENGVSNIYRVHAKDQFDSGNLEQFKSFGAGADISGTYQLLIHKVDEADNPIILNPATFTLRMKDDTELPADLIVSAGSTLSYETPERKKALIVANQSGKVYVGGLPYGAVLMVGEQKAPNGYNPTTEEKEVTIVEKTVVQVTLKNERILVNMTAEKVWDGLSVPVYLQLLQNEIPYRDYVQVDGVVDAPNADGEGELAAWKYTWTKLPKTDVDGTDFVYTVLEVDALGQPHVDPSYTQSVDGMTVTNTKKRVSVGDFVWYDKNHDGLQAAGEPGIEGVELKLTYQDGSPVTDVYGNPVGNVLTDVNGKYSFDNLPPTVGTQRYIVEVVADPEGYVPTKANVTGESVGVGNDSSTKSQVSTALPNDQDRDDTLDFGYIKLFKLGDYVWYDTNRDGIQDAGEKGVPGVTVTISGPNLPAGYTTTTTTDANGLYVFENLPNGEYTVVFSNWPEGYVPTVTGAGDDRTVDSNGPTTTGVIDDADDMTLDLGIVITPTEPEITKKINETLDHLDIGHERDYVYNVVVSVPNTIELYTKFVITDTLDDRLVLKSAVVSGTAADLFDVTVAGQTATATAKAGSFAALKAHASIELLITAQIKAGTPVEVIPNTATLGFVNESGVEEDKESNEVTVTPKLYKLGDYVWYDTNRDGIQDAGEKGVPGVTVTISGPNLPAGYTTTTTTDANGLYVFENLPNGEYTVVFSNWPEGYEPTITKASGSTTENDSNGPTTTGVIDDADDLTVDFGLVKKQDPTPPTPTYPTITVPLSVKKELKNGSLKAGAFTFQLKDRSGKVLSEVTNAANGTVTFPDRTFSKVVSNYIYTIHEVAGNESNIIYDKTIYTVKVTTRAVDGQLQATVNVEKDGTPFAGEMVFTNQRKAPPTGDRTYQMMSLLLGAAMVLLAGAYVLNRRSIKNK